MDRRVGKKRQLTEENTCPTTMNAYRLHFSCENIGKYVGSTKRRIKWCFGFTNLHTGEGRGGIECRGEEHEVELVWSVVSDKVKIVWNKRNISDFFPEERVAGKVDVSWESRSGEKYRIFAHESPVRSPQYDFFIDGVSIFSLQHVSELSATTIIVDNLADCEVLSETSMDSASSRGSISDYDNETRQAPDAGFGLSMAGLSPCDPLDDDLTSSYSFTNILEHLRGVVTSIIPNSEDMVSRSIINALSEDKNSCEPYSRTHYESSSSLSSMGQMPTQIEANLLYETTEWASLHLPCSQRPDVQEQKRLFLQKQMDFVFVHARHERLTEDTAARILYNIATLLDYPIRQSFERERDTIIIRDLKNEINLDALTGATVVFGELREVGVASNRTFAFCRFASETGPLRALAAVDQGTLTINGRRPIVSLLKKPSILGRPCSLGRRAISTPIELSDERMRKPILTRRKSHQRNTLSIDTLIVESPPFLRLVNETPLVSPLDIEEEESTENFSHTKGSHHFSDMVATVYTDNCY